MFILTTIDNHYPGIWEKNGIATFSSLFEGNVVGDIQARRPERLYAAGVYREHKSNAQDFTPSVLVINRAEIADYFPANGHHDIRIHFTFLKKMPAETNALLRKLKKSPFPLVKEFDDTTFFQAINAPKDFFQRIMQASF